MKSVINFQKIYVISGLFCFAASVSIAQINFGTYPNTIDIDYSNPQEYEIGGITVSGIQFHDQNVLISLTGLKVGDIITIPGEEISKAIRNLWDQGILGDVAVSITKIEGNYLFLEFQLKERPRLSKFSFSGVNKSQADEIRESIRLIKGRVVTDALVKNTQTSVKKYFVEKGFLNIEVKIVQVKDTLIPNSIILKINVNKKQKVKINEIIIHGNEKLSIAKIKRALKETKEKGIFKPFYRLDSFMLTRVKHLFKPDSTYFLVELNHYLKERTKLRVFKSAKFLKTSYEEDKRNIIEKYNVNGYRDVTIAFDTIYPVNDQLINIEITMDEGRKYYFRSIIWTGNYIYDDKYLQAILGIKIGDEYNLEMLNKKLNYNPSGLDVSSLYLDNGYLFFNVQPVEVLIEDDSIDIEMRIYEGPQAIINKVTITGNTKTNDHVILREIRTLPGQKFSRSDLIRSQREIAQLGYFNPETIGINPIPNPQDGTVDIEYIVEEKPSDQIQLSGGWGGFLGFTGTLALIFNNFSMKKITKPREWGGILPSGDGQRLSISAQANGKRFQVYSISLTEPWLGGRKPNSFTVSLSRSIQRSLVNVNGKLEQRGFFKVSSATIHLGRRLTIPDDYFTLSHSLSYTLYDFESPPIINSLGSDTGTSNKIALVNTLARNSVDNPTFPRRGSSISLSFTATPPFSLFNNIDYQDPELSPEEQFKWIEYHKWMFDHRTYLKLAGNLVLNIRSHFGFIGSYNDDLGIGPFERFMMGGDGLSGFDWILGTDIVGLRGYPNNSLRGDRENGGGAVFDKFVFELRYPVSLNPMATLYVLAFLEGGNNWGSYDNYNPFDLKRSAGIGARIFMPAFGLIGFDYGWGFDDIPGVPKDKGGEFHFTIGQQIR